MLRKLRKNYRRLVAFMLTAAMTFTSVGTSLNVAFAAGEEQEALFLVDGSDLREAVRDAMDGGETFAFNTLELKAKTRSLKTSYEKLIGGKNGKVYRLDVDVDERYAPENTSVEVFYNAGTEDVIFLFINESDMVVKFRASVDGYETGRVTINPNGANVDDTEASYVEDYSNSTMIDDIPHTLGAEVLNPTTGVGENTDSETTQAGENAGDGSTGSEIGGNEAEDTGASDEAGDSGTTESGGNPDSETTQGGENPGDESTGSEIGGNEVEETGAADENSIPEETGGTAPEETEAESEDGDTAAGAGDADTNEAGADAGGDTGADAAGDAGDGAEAGADAGGDTGADAETGAYEDRPEAGSAIASISIRKFRQVASGVQIPEDTDMAVEPEDVPEEENTESSEDSREEAETGEQTEEEPETADDAGNGETDTDGTQDETGGAETTAADTESDGAEETTAADTESDGAEETTAAETTQAAEENDGTDETTAAAEDNGTEETTPEAAENDGTGETAGAADEEESAGTHVEETTEADAGDSHTDETSAAHGETGATDNNIEETDVPDTPGIHEGQELEDDIHGSIENLGTLDGKSYNTVTIWGSANARAYRVAAKDLVGTEAAAGVYRVDYTVDPVGTADVKGSPSIGEGENLYFGVNPQVGFQIQAVTANGVNAKAVDAETAGSEAAGLAGYESIYVVEAVEEDLEIEVSLEEIQGMTHPEFSPAPVTRGGVTITVHAEEGIIPAGTKLQVTEVTSQLKDAIAEKLESESDTLVQEVIAYDINLVLDGKKLDNSWSKNGCVDVTFSGSRIRSLTQEADKVSFYAVDDSKAAPLSARTAAGVSADELKLEAVGETDVEDTAVSRVSFGAEHFTVYAAAGEGASRASGYIPVENVTINPDKKPSGQTANGKVRQSGRSLTMKVGQKASFLLGAPTNTLIGRNCGHTIAVYNPSDYCDISLIDNSGKGLVGNPCYAAGNNNGDRVFDTVFEALKPGTSNDVRVCYYANFGIVFTNPNQTYGYMSCPRCGRQTLVYRDIKWYRYNDVFGITVNADYKLEYDTRGGSEIQPSVKTVASTDAEFKVTSQVPTKDGCEFREWNTKQDGTGETYMAGDSITLKWGEDEGSGSQANPVKKTLYAIWDKEAAPTLDDLTITKSVGKHNYIVGEEVKYTIEVSNKSSDPIIVTVTDRLPDGLDFDRVSESDGGVYDPDTRTVTWKDVTVHAYGSKQLLVWAIAVQEGRIVNTATVHLEDGSKDSNEVEIQVEDDTPDPPTFEEVEENVAVRALCQTLKTGSNTEYLHEAADFPVYADAVRVGSVQGSAADGYTCQVTFLAQEYTDVYNRLRGTTGEGRQHTLVEGETDKTVVFRWNKDKTSWKLEDDTDTPVTFLVRCPRPRLTAITKELVSINGIDAADIEGIYKAKLGETVTLRYKITVTGQKDAQYTVTDQDVMLEEGASWSGTLDDSQKAELYVTRTITVENVGITTVTNTAYVKPGDNTDPITPPDPEHDPTDPEKGYPSEEVRTDILVEEPAPEDAIYTVHWYDAHTGMELREPESRSGMVDSTVSVTDGDKQISGYTYDAGNRNNIEQDVLARTGTVLKLYFTRRADLSYLVHHIDEDTGTVLLISESKTATFGDVIRGADEKQSFTGYTFVRAEDLTVGTDSSKNIVRVYYSADTLSDPERDPDPETPGDGIPDKYQITFTYKAAANGSVTGITTEVKTIQEITLDPVTGTVTSVGPVKAVNPTQPSTVTPDQGYHFLNWNRGSQILKNDEAVRAGSYTTSQTFVANFEKTPGGGSGSGGGSSSGGGSGSGGGSSSGGGSGSSGSSSSGGGSPVVTIDPGAVPLAEAPSMDDDELLALIDDEEVPLAALPKTGQTGNPALMLMLSGMMLAAFGAVTRKKGDEQ